MAYLLKLYSNIAHIMSTIILLSKPAKQPSLLMIVRGILHLQEALPVTWHQEPYRKEEPIVENTSSLLQKEFKIIWKVN